MKWLAGDKITLADFWIGSILVDLWTNDGNPNSAGFKTALEASPNFTRWAADFKTENAGWIASRPQGLPM
jgi:glutathione S-transferase